MTNDEQILIYERKIHAFRLELETLTAKHNVELVAECSDRDARIDVDLYRAEDDQFLYSEPLRFTE